MSAPMRVRLGELYQQQLASASGNTSAALRAFMLLGMAQAGVNMIPFRREIARALAEELSPEVLAALRRMDAGRLSSATLALAEPEMTAEVDGDPFLSVGMDV